MTVRCHCPNKLVLSGNLRCHVDVKTLKARYFGQTGILSTQLPAKHPGSVVSALMFVHCMAQLGSMQAMQSLLMRRTRSVRPGTGTLPGIATAGFLYAQNAALGGPVSWILTDMVDRVSRMFALQLRPGTIHAVDLSSSQYPNQRLPGQQEWPTQDGC